MLIGVFPIEGVGLYDEKDDPWDALRLYCMIRYHSLGYAESVQVLTVVDLPWSGSRKFMDIKSIEVPWRAKRISALDGTSPTQRNK